MAVDDPIAAMRLRPGDRMVLEKIAIGVRDGGELIAGQLNVPFLGRLPLYEPIRVGGDRGIPLVIAEPDSVATRAFMDLAEAVMAQLAVAAHKNAIANKGKIPLIQVK